MGIYIYIYLFIYLFIYLYTAKAPNLEALWPSCLEPLPLEAARGPGANAPAFGLHPRLWCHPPEGAVQGSLLQGL